MSSLIALSLTTAVLCGIWVYVAGIVGLLGWAGFSGCTSFFAAGGKKEGLKKSIIANITGVVWAMIAIKLTLVLNIPAAGAIMTAVITFGMCAQAKNKWLKYIPGTFFGSFSTFAANGDWKVILPSLVLGDILGYACEWSGNWLFKVVNKESKQVEG